MVSPIDSITYMLYLLFLLSLLLLVEMNGMEWIIKSNQIKSNQIKSNQSVNEKEDEFRDNLFQRYSHSCQHPWHPRWYVLLLLLSTCLPIFRFHSTILVWYLILFLSIYIYLSIPYVYMNICNIKTKGHWKGDGSGAFLRFFHEALGFYSAPSTKRSSQFRSGVRKYYEEYYTYLFNLSIYWYLTCLLYYLSSCGRN